MITHDCTKETEINEIHRKVEVMNSKVDDMHKSLCGNGRAGLIERFEYMEGGLYLIKWAIGGTGILGVICLIKILMGGI